MLNGAGRDGVLRDVAYGVKDGGGTGQGDRWV